MIAATSTTSQGRVRHMQAYICTACGMQYPPSASTPPDCPVCQEERQFVPLAGQRWTTLEALRVRHFNAWRQHEPGLIGIGSQPAFAIGQRALLLLTPNGNVLWDCISLIDEATVTLIKGLGGLRAIAISHPHFYTTLVEWSRAFGDVPVHVHADDSAWVMRPDPCIKPWQGETFELLPGVTLIRGGGHFPGGAMLHWAQGAGGRGVLCSSDIATITPDRKFLSFMRSYPNLIPLSRTAVESIVAAVAPFRYDRIYGAWWDRHIESDARAAVARSLERYVAAIEPA
jgi:hypothetical protein